MKKSLVCKKMDYDTASCGCMDTVVFPALLIAAVL